MRVKVVILSNDKEERIFISGMMNVEVTSEWKFDGYDYRNLTFKEMDFLKGEKK